MKVVNVTYKPVTCAAVWDVHRLARPFQMCVPYRDIYTACHAIPISCGYVFVTMLLRILNLLFVAASRLFSC